MLTWLELSSNDLSNRIKLKKITHSFLNSKIPSIPRSSYKFCNLKIHVNTIMMIKKKDAMLIIMFITWLEQILKL